MSINTPSQEVNNVNALSVQRVVTWSEAIAEAERLGCRVNTSVPSQIDASTRQRIALLLLIERDWGIEGHNYDGKQRPVYAKVVVDQQRQESPEMSPEFLMR